MLLIITLFFYYLLFYINAPKLILGLYVLCRVKIYIHDSGKDIFYELEHLHEIKDRTILKLFETDGSGRGPSGLST